MKKACRPIHYGYVIVGCCCLIMGIVVGLVMSCAGIFYGPVSTDLHVETAGFGLYMSFNFLAASLMLSVAGKMMERFSAHWLLTCSAALAGLTLVAMSTFRHVALFWAAGALLGVSMSFLMYLSFPTMIHRWFSRRVGFFIGVCSAASGIGGIIFNPLGSWLIVHHGWRAAYCTFGLIILLIVTPLLAIFLRNRPEDKGLQPYGWEQQASQEAKSATLQGISASQAIRMPAFYTLFCFAFLIMAISTLNLFIPKYVCSLGFTPMEASLAASSVMAGVTVGKIVLGHINDHSNTWGIIATTSGGFLGLLLLLIGRTGLVTVILGAFLFGWEYAGTTVQTPILVRTVFGGRHYAEIYSRISMALAAGGAISAGAWGFLELHTSYSFTLVTGMALLLIMALLGIYSLRSGRHHAA